MKSIILLVIIYVGFYTVTFAQVGINVTDPKATLDIVGANPNGAVTGTDGLLVPRVNGLVANGTENGQLVYLIADTANLKRGFYSWNGTSWQALSDTASSASSSTLVLPDADIIATSTTPFTVSPSTPITDNAAFNTTIAVSGIVGNTTLITITLDITHTYDNDLELFLQSPTGQIIELSTDNGGGGNNYTNTTFADAGATNITTGTAPFTGTFKPEGSLTPSGTPTNRTGTITTLAGFNGLNPNGNWVLRVGDDSGSDTGTLNSVTINVRGTVPIDWILQGEVSIAYQGGTAIIVQSTYSGDTTDLDGVITALTRSTATAGASGTSEASLPGTILNYASASPSGTGNFWLNTANQARNDGTSGLTNNTLYFYQLWRQANIESPAASNETYTLVPFRVQE